MVARVVAVMFLAVARLVGMVFWDVSVSVCAYVHVNVKRAEREAIV